MRVTVLNRGRPASRGPSSLSASATLLVVATIGLLPSSSPTFGQQSASKGDLARRYLEHRAPKLAAAYLASCRKKTPDLSERVALVEEEAQIRQAAGDEDGALALLDAYLAQALPDEAAARLHLARGQRMLRRGDIASAAASLEAAWRLGTADWVKGRVTRPLTQVWQAEGVLAERVRVIEGRRKEGPLDRKVLDLLGETYFGALQDTNRAVDTLLERLTLPPWDEEGFQRIVRFLSGEGQVDKLGFLYRRKWDSARNEMDRRAAAAGFLEVERSRGGLDEAGRKWIESAAAPGADLLTLYLAAKVLESSSGEESPVPDEAVPLLKRILAINVEAEESWRSLRAVLAFRGDHREMLDISRDLLARTSSDGFRRELAQDAFIAWTHLASVEEIARELEARRETQPDDPVALHLLAQLYWESGRSIEQGKASRFYEAVTAIYPENTEILTRLGQIYKLDGDFAGQARVLEKLYREHYSGNPEKQAEVAMSLAAACDKLGRGEDALRWADTVVKLKNDPSSNYWSIHYAYKYLPRAEAEARLGRLLQKIHRDVERINVLSSIALIMIEGGSLDPARQLLARCRWYEPDPDHVPLVNNLERLLEMKLPKVEKVRTSLDEMFDLNNAYWKHGMPRRFMDRAEQGLGLAETTEDRGRFGSQVLSIYRAFAENGVPARGFPRLDDAIEATAAFPFEKKIIVVTNIARIQRAAGGDAETPAMEWLRLESHAEREPLDFLLNLWRERGQLREKLQGLLTSGTENPQELRLLFLGISSLDREDPESLGLQVDAIGSYMEIVRRRLVAGFDENDLLTFLGRVETALPLERAEEIYQTLWERSVHYDAWSQIERQSLELWRRNGRLDEHAQALRLARAAGSSSTVPDFGLAFLGRMTLLKDAGQWSEEDWATVEAVWRQRPNHLDFMNPLVDRDTAAGDTEAADRRYLATIRHPMENTALESLIRWFSFRWKQEDRLGEMRTFLERELAAHPEDSRVLRALSVLLRLPDNGFPMTDAIDVLERLIAQDLWWPDCPILDDMFRATKQHERGAAFWRAFALLGKRSEYQDRVDLGYRQAKHLAALDRAAEAIAILRPVVQAQKEAGKLPASMPLVEFAFTAGDPELGKALFEEWLDEKAGPDRRERARVAFDELPKFTRWGYHSVTMYYHRKYLDDPWIDAKTSDLLSKSVEWWKIRFESFPEEHPQRE